MVVKCQSNYWGRIIRFCSQPSDLVYDPFSGSATTVAVAKKLGRQYLASDLSSDYVKLGLERLEICNSGDRLNGSAEPTVSSPATKENVPKPKRKRVSNAAEKELF